MASHDPLTAPKADLRAAEGALEKMKNAKSREEFEEEWRDFLGCLEKVWIKTERCCQPFRHAFEPWQGKYSALRRKDMLLRYLKQARDADNHSIQDVMDVTPGRQIMAVGEPGGSVHIKRLVFDHSGMVVAYEGNNPLKVTTVFPKVTAVPVKNNGEWCNLPTTHLGNQVENTHPATLASLGLAFYKDFLVEAERKFFTKATP